LVLPHSIIKSHPEEKWAWPWTRRASHNWGFPFNISAKIEDSDFTIGRLLWLFLKTVLNRKTANINVKKQTLYTSVIDSHIENSKN